MTASSSKRGLLLAVHLTILGCGVGDWKTRLQERFDEVSLEHPLVDEARKAHQRALEAEQSEQNEKARTWALAADRYLSAAIVRGRIGQLKHELSVKRKTHASLSAKVSRLESKLMDRFAAEKNAVRADWLEAAKDQACEHAGDYENKRFRSRNQDVVRLKVARKELTALARLQLEGARALDPDRSLEKHDEQLARCARLKKPLEALDCINRARWQIQEAFASARAQHEISPAETQRLQEMLREKHFEFVWQNDALAIVEQRKPPKAWKGLLEKIRGPIQVHGTKAGLYRLNRLLRKGGITEGRFAKSIIDDGEKAVIYILAYPRPITSQPR